MCVERGAQPEPEQVTDSVLAAATEATRYEDRQAARLASHLAHDSKRHGHAHDGRGSKTLR